MGSSPGFDPIFFRNDEEFCSRGGKVGKADHHGANLRGRPAPALQAAADLGRVRRGRKAENQCSPRTPQARARKL